MKELLSYLKGDRVIWVLMIFLFLGSLVSVYSFVPILIKTSGGTPLGYLSKHFLYILIGTALMVWLHKKDPIYIQRLSKFFFYLAIGLLIFTLFFGVKVNDASRWVRIPIIGLTFQSSDFAKFALVVFVARRLVSRQNEFDSWKSVFMSFIFPILGISALIAKDNFSTAGIVFLIALVMLFVAKFPFTKMLGMIGTGLAGLGIAVLVHFALPALDILPRLDTWLARFTRAYGDLEQTPLDNMQAINAKLAIHNGGYTGVGVGNGELKLYTPEAYADFYYSSFVEEFGLVFALVLIFIYLVLFYRILRIGLNAKDLFETYTAIGIGLIFMSQALVNMFVCTGLMPVTGQIMPFLAMGGSAMVMSCVGIGIVQSIAYKNQGGKGDVNLEANTLKD